jgi:hypothetical protein
VCYSYYVSGSDTYVLLLAYTSSQKYLFEGILSARYGAHHISIQSELSMYGMRCLTKLLMPQVFHLLIVNFLQWICHLLCTGKIVFQYQVLYAAYPFVIFSVF